MSQTETWPVFWNRMSEPGTTPDGRPARCQKGGWDGRKKAVGARSRTSTPASSRVKTEAEQQIWNDCSRLIANAIIYYNTLLLSRVYEHKLAANDQDAIEILKGISPVAWRNVNLIGNFDFTTGSSPVDIEALAERYENPDFWRRSLQEADDDGSAIRLDRRQFYLFEGLGINSCFGTDSAMTPKLPGFFLP